MKTNSNHVYCSTWDNVSQSLQQRSLGQEKQLALFFLDIRNYTRLMDQYSSYEVLYVVRHFLSEFVKLIEFNKGKTVEVTGDNVYAVFGMQEDIETAVQSATKAALEILSVLRSSKEPPVLPDCPSTLEVGIGIHVGNVIVGQSFLSGNEQMTVMGLPVNVASRLQAETKNQNNSILVSEDAYKLLGDLSIASPASIVNIRGIDTPVKVRMMGEPYEKSSFNSDALDDLHHFMAIAG